MPVQLQYLARQKVQSLCFMVLFIRAIWCRRTPFSAWGRRGLPRQCIFPGSAEGLLDTAFPGTAERLLGIPFPSLFSLSLAVPSPLTLSATSFPPCRPPPSFTHLPPDAIPRPPRRRQSQNPIKSPSLNAPWPHPLLRTRGFAGDFPTPRKQPGAVRRSETSSAFSRSPFLDLPEARPARRCK